MRRNTCDQADKRVVIRETRLVKDWTGDDETRPKPPIVGTIGFARNRFRDLPVGTRKEMREMEKGLSDAEGNWMATSISLDPEHGGKGLMTVSSNPAAITSFRE